MPAKFTLNKPGLSVLSVYAWAQYSGDMPGGIRLNQGMYCFVIKHFPHFLLWLP